MKLNNQLLKKICYTILPVMAILTFNSPLLHAGDVCVVGEGNLPSSSGSISYGTSNNVKDALKEAAKINKQNADNKNSNPDADAPKASSSNAANYTMGIGAVVNPQTGQLGLNFNNIKLAGKSSAVNVDFGLSNSGVSKSIYNLPVGWKFNVDHIDTDAINSRLHLNSGMNSIIDPDFKSKDGYASGLKYCTTKAISFKTVASTVLSYDTSLSYKYILTSNTGTHEYFDSFGKLICQDDRFRNNIIYSYQILDKASPFTVYNAELTSVKDSNGQIIKISSNGSAPARQVTVTMPDGRTAVYTWGKNITVKNLTGLTSTIKLTNNKVSEIDYPTGGIVKYTRDNTALPYTYINSQGISTIGDFNPIVSVVTDPGFGQPEMTTTYKYNVNGHDFAGNGDYVYKSGSDCVTESNDNGYKYNTIVTQNRSTGNGGPITTTQTYNFLHLPLSSKTGDCTTTTTYMGESDGSFPQYNHLPSNYNSPVSVVTTGLGDHKVDTTYNDYGQPTSVTTYNKGVVTLKKTMAYDNNVGYGQLKTETVEDNLAHTTTYTTNTIFPNSVASTITKIGQEKTQMRTTTTDLGNSGRPVSMSLGDGASNGAGSLSTTTTYSLSGSTLTVATTDALGHIGSKIINTANGEVESETDAMNHTISYKYTDNGLIVEKTFPDGSQETIDSSNPNQTKITYPSKRFVIKNLDGLGRVLSETDSFSPNVSIRRNYNMMGKVATEAKIFGNQIQLTTYKYNDWKGRLTSKTDYLGNTQTIAYDDAGNTSTTSFNGVPTATTIYDDSGKPVSTTSYLADNGTSLAGYNCSKQEITSSINGGSGNGPIMSETTNYGISGKPVIMNLSTDDGTAAKATWTRNLLGETLNKTTDFTSVSPGISGPGTLNSEIKTYDSDGNMKSLKNQIKQTVSYTYNADGKVTSMKDFSKKIANYAYDNMGRQISVTDGGVCITNSYNTSGPAIGKIASKTISSGNGISDTELYTYDGHANLLSVKMNGKIMWFTYDGFNRLTAKEDYAGITTKYTYDSLIPTEIKSVSNSYGSVEYTHVTMMGKRYPTKIEYSNGIIVDYTYCQKDIAPKVLSVETIGSTGNMINNCTYAYNPKGNISSITETSGTDETNPNSNNVKNYTYNGMGNLTEVYVTAINGNPIVNTKYRYDIRGNIVSVNVNNSNSTTWTYYVYNKANVLEAYYHYIGGGEIFNLKYDANNNMIKDGHGNIYKYNTSNQLVEFDCNDSASPFNGKKFGYSYLANTLRGAKWDMSDPSNKIYFYYSPSGQIINESQGTINSSYLIGGNGQRIARHLQDSTSNDLGKTSYYISNSKDVLGTTDAKGEKAAVTYNYDAYGKKVDYRNNG
jgi:YD repeat-containing protein